MSARPPRIVLVRHAMPVVDAGMPPASWSISAEGIAASERIAGVLAPLGIDVVITSTESKAIATGKPIAARTGTVLTTDARLGEQGLDQVPWIADAGDLRSAVERHFAAPDEAVFGPESANAAAARFAAATEVARTSGSLPAVVSHGRIMSAWVSTVTSTAAATIWRSLRFPDALLIDLETRTWERVDRV